VSALPARQLAAGQAAAGAFAAAQWAQLEAAAPQAVMTFHRYLRQLGTFLAPRSVEVARARCASSPAG
jgi:hypothetical protein